MERHPPPRATATVAGLFLAGLVLGSWTGRAAVARATDPYAGLERFARMLTAIESDYVEPIHGEVLLDGALDGMVARLDPHSRWMSANAVRALEDDADGAATGFGVEVGRVDDGVVVLKVLPGSPAEREGLERGDRIVGIDGQPLAGLPIEGVRALFEGDVGRSAELEVLRSGWEAPQTLRTLRERVRVPATEGALLAGDLMYVRIIDFQREASIEVEQQIRDLQAAATRPWAGLVLDLRDNTGGLLEEAVKVADLFLDEGPIVTVHTRRGGSTEHRASAGGLPRELPIVVLVNGLSASASEIVAGALREGGRARLVGSRTYGKGSVQQLYRNPDGSALKLTIAEYLLPSGARIPAREGLEPDVTVRSTPAHGPRARLEARLRALDVSDAEREELLVLLGALEERAVAEPKVPWTIEPERRAELDLVLRAAVDLLGR